MINCPKIANMKIFEKAETLKGALLALEVHESTLDAIVD